MFKLFLTLTYYQLVFGLQSCFVKVSILISRNEKPFTANIVIKAHQKLGFSIIVKMLYNY
ncbi:MAG: hypothetical protein EOO87_02055 [Pedobacter sp.]|nr:MAG: hypothetical protein EOO87_02055 [Pedobacter sp.]